MRDVPGLLRLGGNLEIAGDDAVLGFAMGNHRRAQFARQLGRLAHEASVAHGVAVVGESDRAGSRQGRKVAELRSIPPARNRRNRIDAATAASCRACLEIAQYFRIVERGECVRHAGDRSKTAAHRRLGSRRDRFLLGKTGLAQMHVHVDESGRDDAAARVDHPLAAVCVAEPVRSRRRVRRGCAGRTRVSSDAAGSTTRPLAMMQSRHRLLTRRSSTAMRTATP